MKALPASSKLAALHLHVAGEQSRLRIHLPFRLQRHDFLGDLLRVIRFVRGDFRFAEREQRFHFRRGSVAVSRNFVSAASASLGFFNFICASAK